MARGLWVVLLGVLGCGRVRFDAVTADAPMASCTTCDDGLIAYWKLDDGGGTAASDSVGGHDGIVASPADWRPMDGIRGGAVALDETYVEVPWDASTQITTAFTVALWVRPAANRYMYDRYIAQFYYDGTDRGLLMMDSNASAGGIRCALHTTTFKYATYDAGVDVDRWTHVACTYDGAKVTAYIDGIAVASNSQTGMVTPTDPMPMLIGGSKMGTLHENEANGLFDDVRVYARALDPSELVFLATP